MYPREAREYINLETHIRMLIKAKKKKKLETADVHQQKKWKNKLWYIHNI